MTGQVLGDVTRVQFGSAADGRSVTLDDDRELHCSGVADGFAAVGSAGVASLRPGFGVVPVCVGSLVAVSAGWACAPNVCSKGSGRDVLLSVFASDS